MLLMRRKGLDPKALVFEVLVAIGPTYEEEIPEQVDAWLTHREDLYWARFILGPFHWQRFQTWWIARRWVQPRDIRKR